MPFRESLACGLQKCVGNQWKGNYYCDFFVTVEDTTFKCHRFILSACSGFFQCLFKAPMKEQTGGCAKLEGMTASTFNIIVSAVYTGVEELNDDNVLDVWSASHMLDIGYLTEECHKFVVENISVDNSFRFLNHATLYAAADVVDHCLDFISRNFEHCMDKDKLLHLPFDQFYKVIANDYLVTSREELVVEVVLKWIKCTPQSIQRISLDLGNNTDSFIDTSDFPTNSLPSSDNQENVLDNQATVICGHQSGESITSSPDMETRESADTRALVPAQSNNVSRNADSAETHTENRKQHLCQLLSACRLFTIKSNFLDSIMKNNVRLLVDTGAYPLMHEALMYTLDVRRRHDTWPDAAVYRASSEFKHVVVFVSKDKVMAYILNTGCVAELANLTEECKSVNSNIIIFDNNLYLLSGNDIKCDTKQFYLWEDNNTWCKVNDMDKGGEFVLLPHGGNIYYCRSKSGRWLDMSSNLCRFCHAYGHALVWSECVNLESNGDCLVRLNKYILVFATKGNVITVECYNTETQNTHKYTTPMSGTSQDMVSFTHETHVYILQRNGSLWKVFSTDMNPVDFELVSKLWDFDCNLKGCVLYKQTFFIFCNNKQFKPLLSSLPGMFARIQIKVIDSKTPCFPMKLKLAL